MEVKISLSRVGDHDIDSDGLSADAPEAVSEGERTDHRVALEEEADRLTEGEVVRVQSDVAVRTGRSEAGSDSSGGAQRARGGVTEQTTRLSGPGVRCSSRVERQTAKSSVPELTCAS